MPISTKARSLWHNRDFLLLWSGQTLSGIGSAVSDLAYPLLILALTHSPAQAGFISAIRSLIYILLVLPAGALLDHWNRKLVMLLCDIGRMLCLISVAFTALSGHLTLAQLYITAIIESSCSTFFNIAEVSCLPQVVAKEQLPVAMGRIQASIGLTNLLGSPLGGLLFTLQKFLPFLFDALSYFISICSLVLIRVSFQEQRKSEERHILHDITEGLHWLWQQPLLRTMALITAGNIFLGAGQTLIIILIAHDYHASDTTIGLIFSFGGVGGILGATLSEKISHRFRFARIIITTLWFFAVLWLSLALLPSPLFLGAIIAALFFLGPIYNVTYVSYRLALTPDILRGRVNSVARLIANGFSPLGIALTGILLQYFGPTTTIIASASGQILLAIFSMTSTSIRKARF